jgi:hypothetical protein
MFVRTLTRNVTPSTKCFAYARADDGVTKARGTPFLWGKKFETSTKAMHG